MSSENIIGYKLPKKDFSKFMKILKKTGEVYAPQKNGNWLRLEELKNIKQINYKGITWYSAKKHLIPQKQVLFEFDGTEIKEPENENKKKVLFGLRPCDLNSLRINDILFALQEPAHPAYKTNRENIILVGLWCNEQQDEYCFCDSMELKHYYDLCLFDKGTSWHLKSGSEIGDGIIKLLKLRKENYEKDLPKCERKLFTTDIAKYFDRDDVWREGAIQCLSCGNCTSLCPTCLCFDIEDDINLDFKSGQRIAKWDSCMYKDFTSVAGGHVFREPRVNRFKHRFFHKLDYFKKKTGELMCTGCGRCIRGCPSKIDWIKLINNMEAKK